jgi:hypothetical protein
VMMSCGPANRPEVNGLSFPSSYRNTPGPSLPLGAYATVTATTRPGSALPHPRGKSLKPGSSKEDLVRRYVEEKLMHTSRRYVKKFGQAGPGDDVVGYKSFSEVCKDLDSVVNVLWLSGTREYTCQFCMKFIAFLLMELQPPYKYHSC